MRADKNAMRMISLWFQKHHEIFLYKKGVQEDGIAATSAHEPVTGNKQKTCFERDMEYLPPGAYAPWWTVKLKKIEK